jgi:rhodanese-related sulfurtransferase
MATTRETLRIAIREAAAIVLLACLLGFAFTAFHGRGLFSSGRPSASMGGGTPAPERITYAEAMRYLTEGTALFIDARHGFDFRNGHIPRAINIPLAEAGSLQPLIASLPKSNTIITYCDGQECNSSDALARILIASGCTDVKVFWGGWNSWQSNAGEHQTEGK